MKIKKQKTLGALLVFALCVALLAVLPFAAGAKGELTIVTTEDELTEALTTGKNIKFGASVTATANMLQQRYFYLKI